MSLIFLVIFIALMPVQYALIWHRHYLLVGIVTMTQAAIWGVFAKLMWFI